MTDGNRPIETSYAFVERAEIDSGAPSYVTPGRADLEAPRVEAKRYGSRDLALQRHEVFKDVYVPVWDAWYRIKGLTGQQRDAYEASLTKMIGNAQIISPKDARAKLVQLGTVDERGELIFSPDDVRMLSKQPAKALEVLFDAIREASGMTQNDFNEMTANFPDDPNDDSISA